jgi:hypothetical protein
VQSVSSDDIPSNRAGCSHALNEFGNRLLIEAPRTSAAVPNEDGSLAIFTVSTYSIDAQTEIKEVKILNLATLKVILFADNSNVESAQWLIGDRVLWKVATEDGASQLWVADADKKKYASLWYPLESY